MFVVALVVIVFMVLVGFPFLIALGELVLVLLLTLGGALARMLFRRPWTVDAVGPTGEHHRWEVVGWRKSGAARRFIAERLTEVGVVPTGGEVEAAVLAT